MGKTLGNGCHHQRRYGSSLNSKHISCCLNGILPFLPPHFFSPCSVHPFTHAPTVQAVTCAICLDICIDPTSCKNGHLYCLDCLRSHLTVSQYRSCPTCRISIEGDGVRNMLAEDLAARLRKAGKGGEDEDEDDGQLKSVLMIHTFTYITKTPQYSLCSDVFQF